MEGPESLRGELATPHASTAEVQLETGGSMLWATLAISAAVGCGECAEGAALPAADFIYRSSEGFSHLIQAVQHWSSLQSRKT